MHIYIYMYVFIIKYIRHTQDADGRGDAAGHGGYAHRVRLIKSNPEAQVYRSRRRLRRETLTSLHGIFLD